MSPFRRGDQLGRRRQRVGKHVTCQSLRSRADVLGLQQKVWVFFCKLLIGPRGTLYPKSTKFYRDQILVDFGYNVPGGTINKLQPPIPPPPTPKKNKTKNNNKPSVVICFRLPKNSTIIIINIYFNNQNNNIKQLVFT